MQAALEQAVQDKVISDKQIKEADVILKERDMLLGELNSQDSLLKGE
jgi:hypothetical protein